MMNLTTGPVTISPEVKAEISKPEISHRSARFITLFNETKTMLCQALRVKDAFILSGSGTLANDAMIAQIAQRQEYGIVFSNGEFGERLAAQAKRFSLRFTYVQKDWGSSVDFAELEQIIKHNKCKWLLLCHCETSTGQVINLAEIVLLGRKMDCKIYLDCMSSFATQSLDLSGVAIATASSGKGAAAVPGLALIFANIDIAPCRHTPIYIDLHHAQKNDGIPFTLSSILLSALHKSLQKILSPTHWNQLNIFSEIIYHRLSSLGLIPFATPQSRVFTIVPAGPDASSITHQLSHVGIQLSYQSQYLLERNWLQLAVFGNYTLAEIHQALDSLVEILANSNFFVPRSFKTNTAH